ncbi:hypothetical protein FN846DRAFT_948093 [Sphaerosporella brunnea]|uniref:Uncharacterized protein n=1 Tax=Sphaerosporella brunnea TaxID=1250544 RepID=A0A5J5EXU2_9PEZI|nr:hypothetical protein FN846DRAFT_948093 [Sphaerosporella brunnea]
MFALRTLAIPRGGVLRILPLRGVSTLADNADIYVHALDSGKKKHLLTLHSTSAPNPRLALGTTTSLPPTPSTFVENPAFLPLLQRVLREHASKDPQVQADALGLANATAAPLFTDRARRRQGGSGGANYQGGAGGGGVGGWVHVYDQRGVPAFGRIADTEDIFGSLLVDAHGQIVDKEVGGVWEESRMYRLVSGRGVMRLTPYLRDRVREALEAEEKRGSEA